jgi:myo-inositol-1(or 4)-monophosphatase
MTDRDLELRLLTACAVAREAGRLAHDYFVRRAELDVEHKSGAQDLVSIADREVEKLIRARLATAFPDDGLLGEEGGGGDRWRSPI